MISAATWLIRAIGSGAVLGALVVRVRALAVGLLAGAVDEVMVMQRGPELFGVMCGCSANGDREALIQTCLEV